MKNTIISGLLIASAFLAFSCQQEEQPAQSGGNMRGEYYAGIAGEKQVIDLFPGGSQTFDLRAYARGGKVSDVVLNLSFKADPELVAAFNADKGTNYEMCPGSAFEFTKAQVMMPRYGVSSTTGKVKVVASGLDASKEYILPITLTAAKEGENFDVADTLAAYVLFRQMDVDPSKGMGTQDSPFMIYSVDDLKDLDSKLQDANAVYFKLANDLDMSGVTGWKALNANAMRMNFDGDGHTISNFTAGCALFENVAGSIHDLNITNAKVVNEGSGPVGVLAARCGNIGVACSADHIYVQGSLTDNTANGAGGIFGIIADATLNACASAVDITSNKYDVGGIFGYDNSASTVSNCWSSGKIKGTNRYTGGIAGQIYTSGTGLYNCYSTSAITGHFYFGGIAGSANLGAKGDNATNTPNNHIEKCIAWNEFIVSDVTDESEHYSCGVIVGYTALKNYHVDCYRKYGIEFKECPGNAGNVPCDHANSSPENPLVIGLPGTYVFPYHGKEAAKGATVSSIAKQLGWDESLWDLSGDLPFFKGAAAPVEDPDVPAGGQLPDFDDNILFN